MRTTYTWRLLRVPGSSVKSVDTSFKQRHALPDTQAGTMDSRPNKSHAHFVRLNSSTTRSTTSTPTTPTRRKSSTAGSFASGACSIFQQRITCTSGKPARRERPLANFARLCFKKERIMFCTAMPITLLRLCHPGRSAQGVTCTFPAGCR